MEDAAGVAEVVGVEDFKGLGSEDGLGWTSVVLDIDVCRNLMKPGAAFSQI